MKLFFRKIFNRFYLFSTILNYFQLFLNDQFTEKVFKILKIFIKFRTNSCIIFHFVFSKKKDNFFIVKNK